jgi:monofunctional glycosyltransferase
MVKKLKVVSLFCLKWFFIISISSVILLRWIPVPVTPFMLVQVAGQAMDKKRTVRLEKKWIPLDEISPHLQLAAICSEDQNFVNHFGLDIEAIEKAVQHNKGHKRKRGASTITQQTAKNVFLYDGRNWVRKAFEVYFTFLIEVCWSKERIMEVYLNVIEFGDGIYGAEAAAKHFYATSAKKISKEQSAKLVSVLPMPKKLSVSRPSPFVYKRQAWVLEQMDKYGKLEY